MTEAASEKGLEILASLRPGHNKPEEGGRAETRDILSIPVGTLNVQTPLFTRKARLTYVPFRQFLGFGFVPSLRLNWVHNLPSNARVMKADNMVVVEMENIPPFLTEDFMTPEESEQMSVRFYYCDGDIVSPEDYWNRECGNWQKGMEKFVGDSRKIASETRWLLTGLEDPLEKLAKIYERVQKIRNLSYEERMTSKQKKAQKIKDNRNAEDVLQRGYGLRSDITRLFVAMARAAGIEAWVVRVATRDDKFFSDRLFNLYDQLDSEMVEVNCSGQTLFLDPSTPFCPFGLVHWSRSDTTALRPSESPPAFFRTPPSSPDMGLIRREFDLRLDSEGNLMGDVNLTFGRQEALTRRLKHILSDEVEIRKDLEEEFLGLLPAGAKVSLLGLDNMATSAPEILARFEVTIPGIGTTAGSRLLLPISPLQGLRRHPFRHNERRYPVYFSHPFAESCEIVITLPAGMTLASSPPPQAIQGKYEEFSLACVPEGENKLRIRRDLSIKRNFYPVADYVFIKSFYDQVRAWDEQQIVLLQESNRAIR
jgi:hypothetical protein